ncbi:hypothetical protein GOB83_13145 [Acetobacter fabarum]|nr:MULTISPECIES: hypothetical protein [Acetobacteraceae]NHO43108.1 hypothetical protein [Acetobacter fabarum]
MMTSTTGPYLGCHLESDHHQFWNPNRFIQRRKRSSCHFPVIARKTKIILNRLMGSFSLDETRQNALRAISPIEKLQVPSRSSGKLVVFRGIPSHDYYLVFFLFVDLLGFKYLGPFEKVAYIIQLDFEGQQYSIVYAKFGMRIECSEGGNPEAVYAAVKRGIKAARPYYLWRAKEASTTSNLNLESKCPQLWEKYVFLKEQSKMLLEKFESEKENRVVEKGYDEEGSLNWTTISFPAYDFRKQSVWLHETAVDAFFCWCEQALVHIAVLMCKLTTGKEIADLLRREFGEKCKLVFDLSVSDDKLVYDEILDLRTELRNYVAHGSFGKDGSTFQFHSRVGSVPLKILDNDNRSEFRFGTYNVRNWENDYARIERFLSQLWSMGRGPARQYLETGFPCVLTLATDGTYQQAMKSDEEMGKFIEVWAHMIDDSANMDF